MRTTLLFLAILLAIAAIAAIGFGLHDRAWRDVWSAAGGLRSSGDLRPVRPTNDSLTIFRLSYDGVLKGSKPLTEDERTANQSTPEMPRTACNSVEVVHHEPAKQAHERTIHLFTTASGFGFVRGAGLVAEKGIDRVELVSLLME